MKKPSTILALLLSCHVAHAFVHVPPSRTSLLRPLAESHRSMRMGNGSTETTKTTTMTPKEQESTMDALLESGQLRLAINHIQQHPSLNLTRERWQRIFDAIEVRTAQAEENTVNTRAMLVEYPHKSPPRMEMTDMYHALHDLGHLRLFGAIGGTGTTHQEGKAPIMIASGSHTVTPTLLEQVTNLTMKSLTPQPTSNVLFAGIALALVEGILSIVLHWNFNFLVISTLMAMFLDKMVLNGTIFESILKLFYPEISQKIIQHEAGHFLCAYLLGCPVEGCVLSAWEALLDARFYKRTVGVSAGTSFFDPILSDELNKGAITRNSVDRYSIIVMGGIAAEALTMGRADGGAGDEMALVAFLSQLNGNTKQQRRNSNSNINTWNDSTIRNQARWGALQAVLMLKEYKPCYDALVEALERGGKLGDCIHAIEQAGRQHNLEPLVKPVGYILDQGPYGEWTTTEMPTTSITTDDTTMEAVQTATTTTQANKHKPTTTESMDNQLKEYRTQVEERLREIDARIQEIND